MSGVVSFVDVCSNDVTSVCYETCSAAHRNVAQCLSLGGATRNGRSNIGGSRWVELPRIANLIA